MMDTCSIRKTECADIVDILGEPYCICVLKQGYSLAEPDGSFRADGTISLLTGPKTILVDTGGPWDRDFLLSKLKEKSLTPADVTVVLCTHGHSDHVGNLGLFPGATIVVGCDISQGDRYLPNHLAEGLPYPIDDHVSIIPTAGHTGRDISVLVKGSAMGDVLVAGDLFECCNDENSWKELSENPHIQEVSRQAALRVADVIIPGHGPLFKDFLNLIGCIHQMHTNITTPSVQAMTEYWIVPVHIWGTLKAVARLHCALQKLSHSVPHTVQFAYLMSHGP